MKKWNLFHLFHGMFYFPMSSHLYWSSHHIYTRTENIMYISISQPFFFFPLLTTEGNFLGIPPTPQSSPLLHGIFRDMLNISLFTVSLGRATNYCKVKMSMLPKNPFSLPKATLPLLRVMIKVDRSSLQHVFRA